MFFHQCRRKHQLQRWVKSLPTVRFRAISEHDSGYSNLDILETLSILSSEISILKSRYIESKQGETLGKCSVLTIQLDTFFLFRVTIP